MSVSGVSLISYPRSRTSPVDTIRLYMQRRNGAHIIDWMMTRGRFAMAGIAFFGGSARRDDPVGIDRSLTGSPRSA